MSMKPSPKLGEEFLKAVTRHYKNGEAGTFDTVVLATLDDIKGSPGEMRCSFKVTGKAQNRYGTFHGGAIATVVDTVGSAALVTQSERSGVSLSISVDYHSSLPGGEICLVTAKVVKIGRSIATIHVDLHSKATGKLVASGRHTKFLAAGLHPSEFIQEHARSKL